MTIETGSFYTNKISGALVEVVRANERSVWVKNCDRDHTYREPTRIKRFLAEHDVSFVPDVNAEW